MAAESAPAKDQLGIYKTLIAKYPDDRFTTMAKGSLKRLEAVGKPFEIEFTDAIKGTTVSMKALRGKVVVVDFVTPGAAPVSPRCPR